MPRLTSRPKGAYRLLAPLTLVGVLCGTLSAVSAGATSTGDQAGIGSIAGVVTSQSGAPLSGICVELWSAGDDWLARTTTTDTLGVYHLGELNSGSYKVYFAVCPPTQGFVSEWYDDTWDRAQASLVAVVDGQETSGIDAELALGGALSGRVTDTAGLPLESVCVAARSGGYIVNTSTNALGAYRVDGLPVGEYRVEFRDCDASPTYVTEWYDDRPTLQSADPVDIEEGRETTGIDAELATGSSISGTVTDEDGQPLAGICVFASKQGFGNYDLTDASGAYSVGALVAGDYRVNFSDCNSPRVFAGEYYDDKLSYEAANLVTVQSQANLTGIDAELATGGSISGTVTDEHGQPLAGICVSASAESSGGSDQTDVSGAYTITALATREYRLYLYDCNSPRRYSSEYYDDTRDYSSADLVAVTAGAGVTGIDADLSLGGSISGTVTDEAGQPLAGICVSANGDAWGATDQTDASGIYAITTMPPGEYRMHFSDCNSPRRFVSEWHSDRLDYATADPISVGEGAEIAGVDAALALGGAIAGTVTDAAGGPLDDVCVRAKPPGSGESTWGYTDASGVYEVGGLRAGQYKVQFIDCRNPRVYLDEWYDDHPYDGGVELVTVAAGQTTEGIDAELAAGSSIAGTVTDPAGDPLADICVDAVPVGGGDWGSDQTDASGNFLTTRLRAGDYRIRFEDCESGTYLTEWYDDKPSQYLAHGVTVGEGGQLTGIDAVMSPGSSLSGTVTDEAGDPAETCVAVYRAADGDYAGSSDTDASGRYLVGELAPGEYTVRFRECGDEGLLDEWYDDQPSRRYADTVKVTLGDEATGVDAVLSQGGSISGRVMSEAGEALEGACVYVESDLGDYQETTTDASGHYRATGLVGGPHQVYFGDCRERVHISEWYDGKDYGSADPVDVRNGSETAGVDATLAVGGAIAGVVTDAQGGALSNICVEAHDAGWDHYGYDETDEDGAYRIGRLDTAVYELELYDCDYPSAYADRSVGPIEVVRGAETRADAQMFHTGTITGTVTDEEGSPLGEVCVNARTSTDDYAGGGYSDQSGAYTVDVGAGQYALEFQDCSYPPTHASEWFNDKPNLATADLVTVNEATESSGIDVVLGAGGVISGTVTDAQGQPLNYPCVSAYDASGDWLDQVAGDDSGAYRIGGLGTGAYRLEFRDCSSGANAPEWYSDKPTLETADPVGVVAGSETGGIDAQLGAGGAISGTVTDATGEPIPYVSIDVYGPGVEDYTYTDEAGRYRLEGLATGAYVIEFRDCDSSCYNEYYDDQDTYQAATPVLVTAGAETSGIDAVLDYPALLALSDGPLEVAEGGGSATYSVLLGSRPDGEVTVSLAGGPDLVLAPATLTFTPDDWNVEQQVTVTAVDDELAEGHREVRIEHSVVSSDVVFDAIKAPRLPVRVLDNDLLDITLAYVGPTNAVRGSSVTLRAMLTDGGNGVAAETLTFRLAGFEAQGETDGAGRATVVMPVTQSYGRHRLEISFAGDDLTDPVSLETDFDVVFEHAFTDEGATVFLNTITRELLFEAPGDSSEVKQIPDMSVDTLASGHTLVSVRYSDSSLTLVGEFELDTGAFTAIAKTASSQYVLGRPPDEAEAAPSLGELSALIAVTND